MAIGDSSRERRKKLLCEEDPKPRRSNKRPPNVKLTDFVVDIPPSQPNTPSTSVPHSFSTPRYPTKHRLTACTSSSRLSRTQPNLPATSAVPTGPPIPQLVPESQILKYDAKATPSMPQQVLTRLHNVSCAPLVIEQRTRNNSHLHSRILTPGPLPSPTQHPDMLAMLQDVDELANWIKDCTYVKETLGEFDILTVCPTAPVSHPHTLGPVGSSTSVRYPVKLYHGHPRELSSPIASPAAASHVVPQPLTSGYHAVPNVLPTVSPPSGMISFKIFCKQSRTRKTLAPRTNTSWRDKIFGWLII